MRYTTLIAIVFAAGIQVAEEEKSVTEHDRVERLIEQWEDDSFANREAVTKQLREVGVTALAHLLEATQADDPEVAVRAERLIPIIQLDHVSQPTLVSLSGKGLQARAVFTELARQANTPVYFWDKEELRFNNVPIDVDFQRVPFWEAFLETCRLSNNTFDGMSGPDFTLRAGLDGIDTYLPAGPLMVKFHDLRFITRRLLIRTPNGCAGYDLPCIFVQYVLYCEGKIKPQKYSTRVIRSCLTDVGSVAGKYQSDHSEHDWGIPQREGVDWAINSVDVLAPPEKATTIKELTFDFPMLLTTEIPELPELTRREVWVKFPITLRDIPLTY